MSLNLHGNIVTSNLVAASLCACSSRMKIWGTSTADYSSTSLQRTQQNAPHRLPSEGKTWQVTCSLHCFAACQARFPSAVIT